MVNIVAGLENIQQNYRFFFFFNPKKISKGIIIDTFGLLRDKENEKIKDIQQICFICGLNREIFDRKSDLKGGFQNHIKVN